MRRGSGRLSTLRLAPAWPGPRGRKFFPAPALSCPPSRSLLHNSPLPFKPSGAPDPTSHSQMLTFLFCTPMLASGLLLGGSFHSIRQLRIPGSRALRPCKALATRLPASATAPPRGLSLLFSTSTAGQIPLPDTEHKQSLQSACAHMTPYTSSQHTSTPFSKHTKSTCASQMHKSDSHRCPTHV